MISPITKPWLLRISLKHRSTSWPPPEVPSPWQVHFIDWMQGHRGSRAQNLNVSQAAKEASREYINLKPNEKEVHSYFSSHTKVSHIFLSPTSSVHWPPGRPPSEKLKLTYEPSPQMMTIARVHLGTCDGRLENRGRARRGTRTRPRTPSMPISCSCDIQKRTLERLRIFWGKRLIPRSRVFSSLQSGIL